MAQGGRVPEGWRVTLRFLEQRGHFWPWDAADEDRIGAALATPHIRAQTMHAAALANASVSGSPKQTPECASIPGMWFF